METLLIKDPDKMHEQIHSNSVVSVVVFGGKAPYQYSIDNINWQSSNVFTGVFRGQVKIYVKDESNCQPIITEVTVPNLVNLITPNDDGYNDTIDYSALGYKKDFTLDDITKNNNDILRLIFSS